MSRLAPETHWLPRPGGFDRAPDDLRAVVLGGGIAGIASACVLAERGVRVTLLEREPYLGGRAASFTHTLPGGAQVEMERGFHGFFRQYYNLRALLRRVDPDLQALTPLEDYPILGPDGLQQTFAGLPTQPLFQLMQLVWQTPHLCVRDLLGVNKRRALAMLRFDAERTYRDFDDMSAGTYLDSLCFPPNARRMLFDVFAHSFFNPEASMSAGELLMMFHFYFTANPEGLIFDVASQPMTRALWEPLGRWLEQHDCDIHTGTRVRRLIRGPDGKFTIEHEAGKHEADSLVLALDVGGLKGLLDQSPSLDDPTLRRRVASLQRTRPFCVLRLWLDRALDPSRPAFAGTTGVGPLDNISRYDHFQDESRAWAAAHGGSVVELHAYAVPAETPAEALRDDLLRGLHHLYPETRDARIVDACMLLRDDCPAFAPGQHALRPTPETNDPNLALAGDFVRMPFPCALMERAAASGLLAANHLLAAHDVRPEPLHSVPTRGLFAPLGPWGRTGKPFTRFAPWSFGHAR